MTVILVEAERLAAGWVGTRGPGGRVLGAAGYEEADEAGVVESVFAFDQLDAVQRDIHGYFEGFFEKEVGVRKWEVDIADDTLCDAIVFPGPICGKK